jgi:hypothetical protein
MIFASVADFFLNPGCGSCMLFIALIFILNKIAYCRPYGTPDPAVMFFTKIKAIPALVLDRYIVFGCIMIFASVAEFFLNPGCGAAYSLSY